MVSQEIYFTIYLFFFVNLNCFKNFSIFENIMFQHSRNN